MGFALDRDDALTEIPAVPITLDDIQYPGSIFTLWSDAERAALGIYPLLDDPVPDGKVATGSTLERDGDVVRRHWTLEDAPPPPSPASVRLLQFLFGMVQYDFATQAEALAAATVGAVPSQVQALIDTLPPADAFAATLSWAGMIEVDRANPLVNAFAASKGLTAADTDEFFIACAAFT